jgi:RimJ/RimL family protein N-acetyltransferase
MARPADRSGIVSFLPTPITLEGTHVRLEPLMLGHVDELFVAGQDEDIWRYMPIAPPRSPADARAWIVGALEAAETGLEIPFAIRSIESGTAIGSTRFLDIQRQNSSLEIGWTWLGKSHQRTALNTECKYLLLRHAFEDLKAIRVQLKTDGRNTQSQRAIERLGAVREGTLRSHRRLWNGFVRDTVYFSIIEPEWPTAKAHLAALMSRGAQGPRTSK